MGRSPCPPLTPSCGRGHATQPALMDGLVSQAAGGEALGGTRWLLRGVQTGRVGVRRRRVHTSRREDVELARDVALRHVVAP